MFIILIVNLERRSCFFLLYINTKVRSSETYLQNRVCGCVFVGETGGEETINSPGLVRFQPLWSAVRALGVGVL